MSDDPEPIPPPPPPPPPPPDALRCAIAVLRGVNDGYSAHERAEAADQLEAFLRLLRKA